MKNVFLPLSFILIILSSCFEVDAQSLWNLSQLKHVKESLQKPYYSKAYYELLGKADGMMKDKPLSVLDKKRRPEGSSLNDYVSMARYVWPDSTKENGLPYIHKDGLSNPELKDYDRENLSGMVERVKTLALAWYFSDNPDYADKAMEQIEVWFLKDSTRMNPNMEFAQFVPGVNNNRGRSYGILDAYSLVEMLDAASLLENYENFTSERSSGLKGWCSDFLDWIQNSPQGKEESVSVNNHGTAYDVISLALAVFTNNNDLASELIKNFPEKRIKTQIDSIGQQPHELWRTLSFGYSQYNLSHYLDFFQIAKNSGLTPLSPDSEEMEKVFKAFDYLASYINRENEWPFMQISGWKEKEQALCKDLYRASLLNPERVEYKDFYNKNRILDFSDSFSYLYYLSTDVDDAMIKAIDQLEFAIHEADKAKTFDSNLKAGKVSPNSIDKDGNLLLVDPLDWRSGFFPGSLWSIYDYTKQPEWKQYAESFTRPIERAKWHKGTHDLGFMIYDSFGKGFELTGDESYKDIVIQSAKTLISRYDDRVGCIRSWDHNPEVWKYPVIIDNLMNLELLYRATELTGDSIYFNVAERHAQTTLNNHFRSDFSSFHVVDYEPETGNVRMKCTAQGNADDSFWSRGQAWGVYGYTMCYRFTQNPIYLRQAQNIADFILSWKNLPNDGIPYWDMKLPEINNCTPDHPDPEIPRDASAAAIIASALYELSGYSDDEKQGKYKNFADRILSSLNEPPYLSEYGKNAGFILQHSTGHHPAGSEIDVPLSYADYYYLEALLRKSFLHN